MTSTTSKLAVRPSAPAAYAGGPVRAKAYTGGVVSQRVPTANEAKAGP
jgi:hypothetical protein